MDLVKREKTKTGFPPKLSRRGRVVVIGEGFIVERLAFKKSSQTISIIRSPILPIYPPQG